MDVVPFLEPLTSQINIQYQSSSDFLVISNGIGSLRISTGMKVWWAVPVFMEFFSFQWDGAATTLLCGASAKLNTQTPQDYRHHHCHAPIPRSLTHRNFRDVVHLEDHLVRPVTLPQAEVGAEVSLEQRLLLDSGQEGLVNLLLVLCALSSNLLLGRCLTLLEESLLGALLVGLLVSGKVLLAGDFRNSSRVDAVYGDGGLGGDHVAGVNAAERDAVDLEWAGDEQNTLLKNLEEDHTLAPEASSEEDENRAGGKRCAWLVWPESLAGLCFDKLASLSTIFSLRASLDFLSLLPFLLHSNLLGFPYLSWRRLVLGWVVSAGLLGSGCDGPLALLELLGDGAGGRHDANWGQLAVITRRATECAARVPKKSSCLLYG